MYCFSASFCFLCLKHYPKQDLLDINKNKIRDKKIIDVLNMCGIDSNYCDDSFQVYVCDKCVKKVEPFYVFKEKCSKNFTKLKGYVRQMKANSSIAFHANLKVLLSDTKNSDNNNETIEYMDMSQFLEAQIKTEEMEQEVPKEFEKPPEIYYNPVVTNTMNTIMAENNPLGNGQIYDISKSIYDNYFLTAPQVNYDEVASSPESFNDISHNSSRSFSDVQCNDTLEHQCDTCDKSFSNSIQLSIHTFLHTLITYPSNEASNFMKYYCSLCTLDFTGLANIKKHLLVHTMDTIYTCDYCKKNFITHPSFFDHMASNPTHRPFHCKICDCRFTAEKTLENHINSMHDINCVFCKKKFQTSNKLKTHMMKKHNGTYCHICKKSFDTNDYLKIHLFDNHFELQTVGSDGRCQYNCSNCKATFFTKYSLNDHLSGCHARIK